MTKFNVALAARLGVPHASFAEFHKFKHPLVSMKFSEVTSTWPGCGLSIHQAYDLLAHDIPPSPDTLRFAWVLCARRVYGANALITQALRETRADAVAAWCPGTVNGNATRGKYRVLTFGMAHKLSAQYFVKLRDQLDATNPDYTVELSTAVHEGSPWDEALAKSVELMRAIFDDKLRVLGYLGDDALAKELQECDAVAVYFDPAVRENNTTVWAALEAGKTVYTNTDECSPDLNPRKYSWENLVKLLA